MTFDRWWEAQLKHGNWKGHAAVDAEANARLAWDAALLLPSAPSQAAPILTEGTLIVAQRHARVSIFEVEKLPDAEYPLTVHYPPTKGSSGSK